MPTLKSYDTGRMPPVVKGLLLILIALLVMFFSRAIGVLVALAVVVYAVWRYIVPYFRRRR